MGRKIGWIIIKECAVWTVYLILLPSVAIGIFWVFGKDLPFTQFSYITAWKYLLLISLLGFYLIKVIETAILFICLQVCSGMWGVKKADVFEALVTYQLYRSSGWIRWSPEEFQQKFLAAKLARSVACSIEKKS